MHRCELGNVGSLEASHEARIHRCELGNVGCLEASQQARRCPTRILDNRNSVVWPRSTHTSYDLLDQPNVTTAIHRWTARTCGRASRIAESHSHSWFAGKCSDFLSAILIEPLPRCFSEIYESATGRKRAVVASSRSLWPSLPSPGRRKTLAGSFRSDCRP